MRLISLLALLLSLTACMPPSTGVGPGNPTPNGDGTEPEMVPLGVDVKIAYIELKPFTATQVLAPEVKAKIIELWSRYHSVYMFINAGEGLRYWDFGLIKLESDAPVVTWTTGDYNETRLWHYLGSQTAMLEDNQAVDFNFERYGVNGQFVKHPFGMRYRIQENPSYTFSVIGANIDAYAFNQESDALVRLLDDAPSKMYQTNQIVTFGNLTQNCENLVGGLIIKNNDGTCSEQSVIISETLKNKTKIKVLSPAQAGMSDLTDKPIIEVTISL